MSTSFRYFLYIIPILLFIACQDDDANDMNGIVTPIPVNDTTFTLDVINGFGSGVYKPGDTIYIFSEALGVGGLFESWDFGNTNITFLEARDEWRTSFIMPSSNLTVTAAALSIPANFLDFETIQGVNTAKPVYSAFPINPKGTVFVFHGTGGSADGWVGPANDQNYAIVKDLFAAGYGVVITESEESTLRTDLNGDGKIRYRSFPISFDDNIDYQNLEIIISTFENRGDLDREKLFSLGMSSGGSFSGAFSIAYNTVASAVYGAPSQAIVAENTSANLLFCLMPNDEVVGDEAIDEATVNRDILLARDGCSRLFVSNPFPIYPEYFERIGVSSSVSQAILDELKANNTLNERLFFTTTLDNIRADIADNPEDWSNILSLPVDQLRGVSSLINLAMGGHQFYASHNQRTIDFFDNGCN